jgi:uncharacterized protein (TIGR04255 family)
MESQASSAPFTLEPVPEIPLGRAPLEKVLTQVQYSRTPELVTDAGEQQLAAALERYPVRRQGVALNVTMGPAPGAIDQQATTTRLFVDAEQRWTVMVSETAVSLETTGYESREDFCKRARELFDAVASVATPPVVDRVGLRYVDRLREERDIAQLDDYVTPRLRVLHGAVAGDLVIEHSVSETLVRVAENDRMMVRSGLLPPGGGFDPSIPQLSVPTWVLDIDIYTAVGQLQFDSALLDERIRRYADHVYSFFRWATTDAFLKDFQEAVEPSTESHTK